MMQLVVRTKEGFVAMSVAIPSRPEAVPDRPEAEAGYAIVAPSIVRSALVITVAPILTVVFSVLAVAELMSIPPPEKIFAKEYGPAAEELFDRIIQMVDNAGATDADRAVNYCGLRHPAIYAKAAESFAANSSLAGLVSWFSVKWKIGAVSLATRSNSIG
jgi:hypothetical protein